MIHSHKNSSGMTLLEIVLVLGIASGVMLLGIKVYNQFQHSNEARRLSANIEQLFTAMRNFYQINCRQKLDPKGHVVSEGILDPRVANTSDNAIGSATYLRLSINQNSDNLDFYTIGLLNDNNWRPLSPLVDNTITDKGYVMYIIRKQHSGDDPTMSTYTCAGDDSGPTKCNDEHDGLTRQVLESSTPPRLQSKVAVWQARVAVKVENSDNILKLKYELGADCMTDDSTKGCAQASDPDTAKYLVWERPAALLTQNTTSPLWLSSPQIKQFKMQYTNDGMSALSGIESNEDFYNIKNYLCGG